MADALDRRDGGGFNLLRFMLRGAAVLLPVVFIEPAPADLFLIALTGLYLIYYPRIEYPILFLFLVYTAGNLGGVLSVFGSGQEAEALPFSMRYMVIETYLTLAMVAMFFIFKKNEQYQQDFTRYYLYGAMLSCLFVIAMKYAGPDPVWMYRDEFKQRIKGTFKDPNVLGPYLIFPALIAVFYKELKLAWWFRAIAFALIFYILFLTLSRAAIGGVIAAIGVAAMVKWLVEQRYDIILLGSLFAVFGGLTLMALEIIGGGGDNYAASRAGLQEYDAYRFHHILQALRYSFEEPWGLGPAVYLGLEGESPHNLTVGKSVEVGLINAVIITGLLFWATWSGFRCYLKYRDTLSLLLFSGLTAHVIISIVVNSHHWRHMLFMCVLAFARERWLWAHDPRRQITRGKPEMARAG